MEIINFPVAEIRMYEKNPRIHDGAVEKMAKVISDFGFRIPVLVKSDGTLCDGHLRLKAAGLLGMKEVPAVLADDMTDAQIAAFRIAVNKAATFADWDYELLQAELDTLIAQNIDLAITGFDEAELLELDRFIDEKDEQQEINLYKDKQLMVNVMLPVSVLEVFEKAIICTGLKNRADAVKEICGSYINEEERQRVAYAES
jgi:ParB-like chromosome segregation protein Spo0J